MKPVLQVFRWGLFSATVAMVVTYLIRVRFYFEERAQPETRRLDAVLLGLAVALVLASAICFALAH